MLKRRFLVLTILLLIPLFGISEPDTGNQSDSVIVPLEVWIAKEVAKDLERYDLCKQERLSLRVQNSMLGDKIRFKDSVVIEKESIIRNLKNINGKKTKQINLRTEQVESVKTQRNIAIGGGILGIIVTAIIVD